MFYFSENKGLAGQHFWNFTIGSGSGVQRGQIEFYSLVLCWDWIKKFAVVSMQFSLCSEVNLTEIETVKCRTHRFLFRSCNSAHQGIYC